LHDSINPKLLLGKIEQCGIEHLNGYNKDNKASKVEVNIDLFSEKIKIGSSNNKHLKISKTSATLYLSNILLISTKDKGTELTGRYSK
jgi:hypothetical protein